MILWSIARASAFVAFGCYTLVVAWGLLLAGRAFRPAAPQLQYHRFLSTLGLVAVATHVVALLLDRYAKVHPAMLAGIGARPAWLAGVVALWLVVALPLSFALQRRRLISRRSWRGLHYFGSAVWLLAFVHGVASGSDSGSPLALMAYGASAAIVGAAAGTRWLRPAANPVVRRPT
jgi:hypothetical protein